MVHIKEYYVEQLLQFEEGAKNYHLFPMVREQPIAIFE